MEKRIFVAIVISVAVLWGWAAIAPRLFPDLAREQKQAEAEKLKANPAATTSTPVSTTSASPATTTTTPGSSTVATAPPSSTPVSAAAEQRVTVDVPEFTATLSNRGAQLISFKLKKYRAKDGSPVELVKGRSGSRTDFPFAIESQNAAVAARLNSALYAVTDVQDRGARVVEFRLVTADGQSVVKTFRFSNEFEFEFASHVSPAIPYRVVVGPGIRTFAPQEKDSQIIVTGNGAVQAAGKFKVIPREKGETLKVYPSVDFIGIEDNYFLTALKPVKAGEATLRRVQFVGAKKEETRNDLYAGLNAVDGSVSARAFFGPKEAKVLERHGLERALQLGWFGIIARFLLEVLIRINHYTKNYGWAIIVLTIIIKVLLYPLQHKSIVSMKKMQKLQPKMEAIKSKYKKARTDADQRQKMNVEMMKLYSEEKINPMSGCFPILLQLPILWGFYGLLSRAIELRGAPFMLWITDLSERDPYYITPLLMTITMFIQTWITPSTGDPAQRRIFLIMPLVFGFLFKDFPSGLVLYWLVQNILTITQQLIMNKWWKEHPEDLQRA
jgi:YidC/Oxa1 family membrane protein insertase